MPAELFLANPAILVFQPLGPSALCPQVTLGLPLRKQDPHKLCSFHPMKQVHSTVTAITMAVVRDE